MLVWRFVDEFSKKMGKRNDTIPKKNMDELRRYTWPGNIREPRNVIENAMIISSGKTLEVRLPDIGAGAQVPPESLHELAKEHILSALQRTRWKVSGKNSAAWILGLKESTLASGDCQAHRESK